MTSDVTLHDAQTNQITRNKVSFRYSDLYYKTKSLKGKSVCVCLCEREKILNAQSAAFKPPHAKLTELTFSFWVSHLTDGITRLLLEMKSRSVLTA